MRARVREMGRRPGRIDRERRAGVSAGRRACRRQQRQSSASFDAYRDDYRRRLRERRHTDDCRERSEDGTGQLRPFAYWGRGRRSIERHAMIRLSGARAFKAGACAGAALTVVMWLAPASAQVKVPKYEIDTAWPKPLPERWVIG